MCIKESVITALYPTKVYKILSDPFLITDGVVSERPLYPTEASSYTFNVFLVFSSVGLANAIIWTTDKNVLFMTVAGPGVEIARPITDMIVQSFIESLTITIIGTDLFFGFKLLIWALHKIWPEEDPFLREGVGLAIITVLESFISFLNAKKGDGKSTNEIRGLALAFIGLMIAVASIYFSTSLSALLLSFFGLGAALYGRKLAKKPNPTDIGPLGKIEEFIATVSVIYWFVTLLDVGYSYAKERF